MEYKNNEYRVIGVLGIEIRRKSRNDENEKK